MNRHTLPLPIFYGILAGKELAFCEKWLERARESKAEGNSEAVKRRVSYARSSHRDYRRFILEALQTVQP